MHRVQHGWLRMTIFWFVSSVRLVAFADKALLGPHFPRSWRWFRDRPWAGQDVGLSMKATGARDSPAEALAGRRRPTPPFGKLVFYFFFSFFNKGYFILAWFFRLPYSRFRRSFSTHSQKFFLVTFFLILWQNIFFSCSKIFFLGTRLFPTLRKFVMLQIKKKKSCGKKK